VESLAIAALPTAPRVLCLEPDPAASRAIAQAGEAIGFRVDFAASAADALELVRDGCFAIVVTASEVDGLPARELVRRVREIEPCIMFVILADRNEPLMSGDEHDPAIASFVTKPVDEIEIGRALRRAVILQQARPSIPVPSEEHDPVPVLVVDDNVADASLVAALLELGDARFAIDSVGRLRDAVDCVARKNYTLAIVDLTLPDARGLDIVDRLGRLAPETAIVVVSGVDDDRLAGHALQIGAQDFLVKGSLDPVSLARAVRHAVERKRAERRLVTLAQSDQLTGLANRMGFDEQLANVLARAKRGLTDCAVMFLDLDRFKWINDALGHGAGDAVLEEVARRLKATVRQYDTVARLGGDEFAIVYDGPIDQACLLAKRIATAMRSPFDVDGSELSITTSVGVAVYPEGGDTPERLMQSADLALYEAKRDGRDSYRVYGRDHGSEPVPSAAMAERLAPALADDEFRVHHQPFVDLSSGAVVGMESLLRWSPSSDTMVRPSAFLAILESTGLIVDVGIWALHRALAALGRWRKAGMPIERVAINLSGPELEQPGVCTMIARALDAYEVESSALQIEIAESLVIRDLDRAHAVIGALANLGVRIAIDDYCDEISSQVDLKRFAIHSVKIDPSIIGRLGKDPCTEHLAASIITCAHHRGLEVVAEGLETRAQLDWLRTEGCDLAQGYFVARPAADWDPARLEGVGLVAHERAVASAG
jgi:diguanylate cyclase (GGDEF)-like protein